PSPIHPAGREPEETIPRVPIPAKEVRNRKKDGSFSKRLIPKGGGIMEATGGQMILGLLVGMFVLIFLVLRTKVHAFPALIIAAVLTGLIGGMAPPDVVDAITAGFGNTLGSIGLVIGFGVMMGRILEV